MTQEELLEKFQETEQCKQVVNQLAAGERARIYIAGGIGSAEALLAAATVKASKGNHLFVLNEKEEAAYFYNDLQNALGKNAVEFFPASYRQHYKAEEGTQNANILQRAETLEALGKRSRTVAIVSYPEALCEKVVTKKQLMQNTLLVKKGDNLSTDFVNEALIEYGFERVDFVTDPGQFSIRGGIVDIFSYSNDEPYRIELFGDEVDSIRTFDLSTQLSLANFDRISIVPNIQGKLLKESRQSFFDFVLTSATSAKLWVKDLTLVADKLQQEFESAEKAYELLDSPLNHLSPSEMYISRQEFSAKALEFPIIELGKNRVEGNSVKVEVSQSPQPTFNKNFELLQKDLQKNIEKGYTNIITVGNPKQIERLYAIFEDLGAANQDKVVFTPILFPIHEGFIDHNLKLACYTDHQIFERFHRFRLKEGFSKKKRDVTIKELTNLKKGDFITHIDHGVGRFDGLEKIDVNGKDQEAIRIIYKNNDLLYVSIHSLHRISKFSGKEGTEPKVNKLGSNAWQAMKQKTKKRVKEIAFDLIKLYAQRKAKKGFAFSPDTYLQTELEASFIYEDTPDQEKATEAVKKDMEDSSPMDRLICGDVGFGKTEIAIRAAFKAVADSKQVAVLAPTTILTLQHYRSFKERFKGFPCTVDYINRFKTAKEQKETLKKLADGTVDIVIGTHRIVAQDVKFKDLGLLIIDEEQKFGVGAKDKLKTKKVNVDTLTLTATPIPRTLQFSLMGARDMSVINTPPPNRQPVETELVPFNEEVIRDAINYELSRDGQVFFVHNRVQNIKEVAGIIQRLVPDARIAIAHGQMEGPKLEKVMLDFVEGQYDVLLATTIIEAGLDISNANTMIINQAQMFGLSDLHQLRGRVGRSSKRAFCYLLCPPLSSLTYEARKRLTAIEQFSDLGSGFNIAMRDLDIRGAGNLLGGEQSGFISEIGFDMYQKILREAMQELKQNEFKELFKEEQANFFVQDCQIDTDLEIMIPTEYINNIEERLAIYRNLSDLQNEAKLLKAQQDLEDRFGELPQEALQLLDTIRLRWVAKDIGFEKLILKSQKLVGYFVAPDESGESPYYQSETFTKVLNFVQNNPAKCTMKERKEKLTLVFEQVKSIKQAIHKLQEVTAV